MTMQPGHFQLYTKFSPALTAGSYKFTTNQDLSAVGKDGPLAPTDLPVARLDTHVTVTSPRYLLPPDQALSTYPPAGTEGAYGSRLPQVVIKRRTLPWERSVAGAPADTPWLALVVFAEGEADVLTNVDVAQCVTSGVTLPGAPDVAKGSCLSIRKSMVDTIMPTQKDVPLLVHGRQVDLDDTELMMGDDDGYLAVVIANRLPLAVKDSEGKEVPVKYNACLVNLEGQFDQLLPQAPPHRRITDHLVLETGYYQYTQAAYDQKLMGMSTTATVVGLGAHGEAVDGPAGGPAPAAGPAPEAAVVATHFAATVSPETATAAYAGSTSWVAGRSSASVAHDQVVARIDDRIIAALDPVLRFPVLLRWSFTSVGDATFEQLMKHVDSGLLGTRGVTPVVPVGRAPLEVTETGHVGLDQRTRRGDLVRAWYRGPLLPHPADLAGPRLPLAHTGDQLRAVIPDGREDLSLAAAFEIGRLLALSQPSMVAALLEWRQRHYQVARGHAIWDGVIADLGLIGVEMGVAPSLGVMLSRAFAGAAANAPGAVIGPPRELVTPGAPMELKGEGLATVLQHFGLDVAADVELPVLLQTLRTTQVPRVPLADLTRPAANAVLTSALRTAQERTVTQLVAGALSTQILTGPVMPVGHPGTPGLPGGILGGVPVVPHDAPLAEGQDPLDLALHGRAGDDQAPPDQATPKAEPKASPKGRAKGTSKGTPSQPSPRGGRRRS
ncbi:hypothetical protein BJ986_002309 [Phycicoccus badiiscoriae]|uniref:Uncharacterized protein n=1 Tax=Pedococcus badiiscoriae TaxID=642776 RepID=A0A852WRK0_9MICO|nr:hypothetical protein [Pedococcus badiiscoriae]NYG07822.1 hypothetical protein [Pedococcus badiiscoriae]